MDRECFASRQGPCQNLEFFGHAAYVSVKVCSSGSGIDSVDCVELKKIPFKKTVLLPFSALIALAFVYLPSNYSRLWGNCQTCVDKGLYSYEIIHSASSTIIRYQRVPRMLQKATSKGLWRHISDSLAIGCYTDSYYEFATHIFHVNMTQILEVLFAEIIDLMMLKKVL